MSLVVLRMYRGDDRNWDMTLTGDGQPIDLTDATLLFSAARSPGGDAIIELSSAAGDITVTGALAGEINLAIPSADTAELEIPLVYPWPWYRPWTYVTRRLPALKLYWDIQVTSDSLKRTWPEDTSGRPRLGVLFIHSDVTQ